MLIHGFTFGLRKARHFLRQWMTPKALDDITELSNRKHQTAYQPIRVTARRKRRHDRY